MAAKSVEQYRYPGIYPFSAKQKDLFYGRGRDVERLLTLIKVEKQVLLYAKSGIGKSSLLEAGVLPKLGNQFIPVPIRFFAYTGQDSISPLENVRQQFKQKVADAASTPLLDILAEQDTEERLWTLAKRVQLTHAEEAPTVLLVFDQFEELFSYPEEQVSVFKDALHELIYDDLPTDWLAQLEALSEDEERADLLTDEALGKLEERMSIKPIFSIRTDRLALLNALTDKFMDIQKVYHELQPLSTADARGAIEKPARQKLEGGSTAFEFSEEAIQRILHFLSHDQKGKRVSIESTQLQIICQEIEKDLVIGKDKTKILPEDLPNFEAVFRRFYQKAIDTLAEKSQKEVAQLLIEDKLIVGGQRISLDETICKHQHKVTQVTLDSLVDERLLRRVKNSLGNDSYELSHDTLVAPIQALAEERRQREEEAQAEAERQEELRKARVEAEMEKRRREKAAKAREREEKLRKEAEKQSQIAQQKAKEAEEQSQLAQRKTEEARLQRKEAEKQSQIAQQKAKEAEKQSKLAKEKTTEAKRQLRIAVFFFLVALTLGGAALYQTQEANNNARKANQTLKSIFELQIEGLKRDSVTFEQSGDVELKNIARDSIATLRKDIKEINKKLKQEN